MENAEFPVSDINVLWVWWLQSQEEKNSDTIPYYLEYGLGCRQISIARNTSEKYFSKLGAIFRSDILMYLEAFIGEAHYCSKPLLNFLSEDDKKNYFDRFFEGLLKTKEIAKGWVCYFAPRVAELQRAILKELPREEILIEEKKYKVLR